MRADLRVQKTKKMLYQALVELMEEYPFNKIKVVTLVQRSGISKDTFYRHYETIYDLYREMMSSAVEHINGVLYDTTAGYTSKSNNMVRHVEAILENQRVWRVAMLETSPNILIDLLVKHFERTADQYHDGRPDRHYENPISGSNLDLFRRFGCATEVVTIQFIIDHADQSPSELAAQINNHFVAFGESAVRSDIRQK